MNKTVKHILTMVLVISLVLSLMTVGAFAATKYSTNKVTATFSVKYYAGGFGEGTGTVYVDGKKISSVKLSAQKTSTIAAGGTETYKISNITLPAEKSTKVKVVVSYKDILKGKTVTQDDTITIKNSDYAKKSTIAITCTGATTASNTIKLKDVEFK